MRGTRSPKRTRETPSSEEGGFNMPDKKCFIYLFSKKFSKRLFTTHGFPRREEQPRNCFFVVIFICHNEFEKNRLDCNQSLISHHVLRFCCQNFLFFSVGAYCVVKQSHTVLTKQALWTVSQAFITKSPPPKPNHFFSPPQSSV